MTQPNINPHGNTATTQQRAQSTQTRGALLLLNDNQRRQRIHSKRNAASDKPPRKIKSFVSNGRASYETDIENNLAKLYQTTSEQHPPSQTPANDGNGSTVQAHKGNAYRALKTSASVSNLKVSSSLPHSKPSHLTRTHSPTTLSPHSPHSPSSPYNQVKQHRTFSQQNSRKKTHSKSGPPRVRKKRTFKLAEPKDAVSSTSNKHSNPHNLNIIRAHSHEIHLSQAAHAREPELEPEESDDEGIGSIGHYKELSRQMPMYSMKKGRSKSYTPTPPTPPSTSSQSPSPPPAFALATTSSPRNGNRSSYRHQPASTALYMSTSVPVASGNHQRYRTHAGHGGDHDNKKKRKRNSFKLGDDAALLPFNKFVPAQSFESYQTKYTVHTPKIKPGSNQFLLSQKMRELQDKLRNEQKEQARQHKKHSKHKKHRKKSSHHSDEDEDEDDDNDGNDDSEYDELASSMSMKEIKESFGKPLEVLKTIKLPSYPGEIPLILIALKKQLHFCDALKKRRIFHHAVNSSAAHHQIARLIQSFFDSLPSKLLDALSIAYFQRIISIQQIPSIISKIPDPNKSILLWLWDLLADTVEFKELNRMSIDSLAKSMAPKMISNNEYYSAMIQFFQFGIKWRLDLREQK